jgi:hypothetical protein
MRRGSEAAEQKTGGAWDCATTKRADESMSRDSPDVGSIANTTFAKEMLCRVDGCTKGVCIVGMVLRQS